MDKSLYSDFPRTMCGDFPSGSVVKKLPANAGDARDMALIPELGRSPGGGNGNPLQYSCLENSRDRGAWQAAVRGVAESDTLSDSAEQEGWVRQDTAERI